jgi:hypothetical protein
MLIGTPVLDDAIAATDRPRPPTNAIPRLEHGDLVTRAPKLVR